MHNFPRKKLCELINSHGISLSNDARRCEGFLHDTCKNSSKYKREIFVLVNALREGVAQNLLNPPPGSQDALFTRLVNRLHDNLGLDKEAAEWAVQSWVKALGVDITIPIKHSEVPSPEKNNQFVAKLLSIKKLVLVVASVIVVFFSIIAGYMFYNKSDLAPLPSPQQSAAEIKAEKQRLAQLQKEIAAAEEKRLAQAQEVESVQRQIDEENKRVAALQKAAEDEEQQLTQLQKTREDEERRLTQLISTSKEIFRDRLKDGGLGPEMVIIPAGRFKMGDIRGDGDYDERPAHWVNLKHFAMGRYEVTFAEYDRFAEATARKKPNDEGWGRDNRPVINVSWHDAVAFANWLTKQTGRQYRLPSEAEWEYAARAGTKTHYWWGNKVGTNRVNIQDSRSRWSGKQTAPVGSFSPNPFGLYDMVGNVWEWCADYWHKNYRGAPSDGSEWKAGGDVLFRVLRGGSWGDDSKSSYVSHRQKEQLNRMSRFNGFRVVTITAEWMAR
jgi:formylglycine-generating enzyme required for sulfatase activity